MLSYVDDFVYWYTSEELGNWFLDKLGEIFHVKSLLYAHFFMSIWIYQLKYHYISVDQAMYATSSADKYLDISTIKENSKFGYTTLHHDMIFTKEDASTSY